MVILTNTFLIILNLLGILNKYSEATVNCHLKTQQIGDVTELLTQDVKKENTTRYEMVEIGKSIILRQLVGSLASLMRHEAKQENPITVLDNHVDGIVIEAETPLHYYSPDQRRRKAVLIIGEMPVLNKTNAVLPGTEINKKEEISVQPEQLEKTETPFHTIEVEKEAEKLRRQEWTMQFLKQRQEELKRREEWQVKDTKLREDELKRRHDWSESIENKLANLTSTNNFQSKIQNNNAVPVNTMIETLFDAFDNFKNRNSLV